MSGTACKRGKALNTLLVVRCSRKRVANGDLTPSPGPEEMEDSSENTRSKSSSKGKDARQMFDSLGFSSNAQMEVQMIESPSKDQLRQKLEEVQPHFIFYFGEQDLGKNEVGSLFLEDKLLSADNAKSIFWSKPPDLVYLEAPGAVKLAEVFHSMGCPHVIYWKTTLSYPVAVHFRHALFAALRSPKCGAWDAFQFAKASFQVHCSQMRSTNAGNGQKGSLAMQPSILGEAPPKPDTSPKGGQSDTEENSSAVPLIQIFDEESDMRLLVCAEAWNSETKSIGALADGLGALLAIEAQGIRLIHRMSAPPPPNAAATFARGVVTMRCDLCTSSSARISLLVSGSAQTCFDDQLLESTIKRELVEKSQALKLVTCGEDKISMAVELRRSLSVGCGAAVVEVRMKAPYWAVQALRQLSTVTSYRSLVALGIAGIEGAAVAAFQKEDAERLIMLRADQTKTQNSCDSTDVAVPFWLAPATPCKKRENLCNISMEQPSGSRTRCTDREMLLAAMKPVPHTTRRKLMPFAGVVSVGAHAAWSMKVNGGAFSGRNGRSFAPNTDGSVYTPLTHSRQAAPGLVFPIMPPVVKKHGCNRPPIAECSEAEFLNDVMQFLVSRGHGRLIPPTGLEAFPDAVLNGKRLDLYNLYREVVSRGGFRVGNGINWKGQVFAKMHNHTLTNRMTGVGNTLKKHYETYLLEYELAHEDVDGECCILCRSSAEGDWVNCGVCGEWAHFGCDRRTGLGSFKDYAKTDGQEYVCPRCSIGNRGFSRRKKQRALNENGNSSLKELYS